MILNVPSSVLKIKTMDYTENGNKHMFEQPKTQDSVMKELEERIDEQPTTDDEQTKAFFGISLTRKNINISNDTITHQTVFDFNELCDRDYEYVQEISNDGGWLVGGGESYQKDTAHISLLQIGKLLSDEHNDLEEEIIQVLYSGKIIIPEIEIVPTSVFLKDRVDDFEYKDICVRFEMLPSIPDFNDINAPLPVNWSLRFIQNQLLHSFPNLSDCSFFYMTIAKSVKFKSSIHQTLYLGKCFYTLKQWKQIGPKALNNGGWDIDGTKLDDFINSGTQYHSGIWLYENQFQIAHFTPPNFLPPYDTVEKKEIILKCISKEWDSHSKQWKNIGYSFMREKMNRLKQLNNQSPEATITNTAAHTDTANNFCSSLIKVDYTGQSGCTNLFCDTSETCTQS